MKIRIRLPGRKAGSLLFHRQYFSVEKICFFKFLIVGFRWNRIPQSVHIKDTSIQKKEIKKNEKIQRNSYEYAAGPVSEHADSLR